MQRWSITMCARTRRPGRRPPRTSGKTPRRWIPAVEDRLTPLPGRDCPKARQQHLRLRAELRVAPEPLKIESREVRLAERTAALAEVQQGPRADDPRVERARHIVRARIT